MTFPCGADANPPAYFWKPTHWGEHYVGNKNGLKPAVWRIAKYREKLASQSFAQVEVADRLGKARSFVSKCELRERRVDFVELQQLARIYKKHLAFFRDWPTASP